MLKITDAAIQRIERVRTSEARQAAALRITVEAVGPGRWQPHLAFEDGPIGEATDILMEVGSLMVRMDVPTARVLERATLDYVDGLTGGGFAVHMPSTVAAAGAVGTLSSPLARGVQRLLDAEINPAIAMHGGQVSLADVQDGTVYLAMSGGCQGCGMASLTLRQGIETRLRQAFPEIGEIVDVTDHASGANPYVA